jgi:hypothetical protein
MEALFSFPPSKPRLFGALLKPPGCRAKPTLASPQITNGAAINEDTSIGMRHPFPRGVRQWGAQNPNVMLKADTGQNEKPIVFVRASME